MTNGLPKRWRTLSERELFRNRFGASLWSHGFFVFSGSNGFEINKRFERLVCGLDKAGMFFSGRKNVWIIFFYWADFILNWIKLFVQILNFIMILAGDIIFMMWRLNLLFIDFLPENLLDFDDILAVALKKFLIADFQLLFRYWKRNVPDVQ